VKPLGEVQLFDVCVDDIHTLVIKQNLLWCMYRLTCIQKLPSSPKKCRYCLNRYLEGSTIFI